MKLELFVLFLTYIVFQFLRNFQRIIWIVVPVCVIRFGPEHIRSVLLSIITWNILDAFEFYSKNEDEYKCTPIASILKSEKTDDEMSEQSSTEKDLPLNSSGQPTGESEPLQESTSHHQNTDVL